MDKKYIGNFCQDVYDILAGNTRHITPEQFRDKYIVGEECEIDCLNNIINIGQFTITVE